MVYEIIPQPDWELKLNLDLAHSPDLKITAGETPVLDLKAASDTIQVELHTQWPGTTEKFGQDPRFTYRLTAACGAGAIKLIWLGYVCQLYVDGILMDEEWPLGKLAEGPWTVEHNRGVTACAYQQTDDAGKHAPQAMTFRSSEFALPGHNTFVGDCMPFSWNNEYCLYYLFDRRHHGSKQGLGAHQWGQLTSADLKSWVDQPLAIDVTAQWEGSICTGSLLQVEDTIYAFYAVRMSDGSPAMLSWATSKDGIHFAKSEQYFALTAPYEPVSARDPMVFAGADGQYHMLVTTSLVDKGLYGGCLAHLVSSNLQKWEQLDPFIVPGYADQPECSDYFEWNGWYYLVFSNYATARYRMSRTPFGPWIKPAFDELDARDIHVPKTAAFHGRRLMTGFLATQRHLYAGTAITHELFQRADGTLGAKHVQELLPAYESSKAIDEITIDGGSGRKALALVEKASDLRLRGTLTGKTAGVQAGIHLRFGADERAYDLSVDFSHDCVRLMLPGETNPTGDGRMPLTGLALENRFDFDLVLHGDVLDVALADGRMITCRLNRKPGSTVSAMLYAQTGSACFSNGQYDAAWKPHTKKEE